MKICLSLFRWVEKGPSCPLRPEKAQQGGGVRTGLDAALDLDSIGPVRVLIETHVCGGEGRGGNERV